uniref:Elongation of very long chain fatty acids protein n=1 Tax=Nilaparvata lugens TaxID=108931 RepID=A0A3Q8G181_NILLU|nr:fatty acid elongase [Nilaparvata lugens]
MFILDLIQKLYHNVEYVWPDPRTRHYPLVYTPLPYTIVAIFLFFTYYLGPKYMRGRQPYRLEKIVIIYNFLQMIFNGYLVVNVVRLCYWPLRYSLWCQPVETGTSPREVALTDFVWLYYMSKIIDVLDTVFIILRKKYSQLTLLHVYHHAGMILISWCGIKYVPGGQSLITGVTNCFVHVVMYGYYLLTLVDKRYASSWWKKHITQMQMFQFFIICVHHSISAVSDCGYNRYISALVVPCTFSITYLFVIFYWNAYIEPAKKEKRVIKLICRRVIVIFICIYAYIYVFYIKNVLLNRGCQ